MRKPSNSDFSVSVEGVGDFVFGYRKMRDQIAIDTEIAKLTEGLNLVPDYLITFVGAFAAIKVLAVEYPDKWDPENLDPLEEDSFSELLAVHRALREKERTFRAGTPKGGQVTGQGAIKDSGVLVSQEAQPDAQRSDIP